MLRAKPVVIAAFGLASLVTAGIAARGATQRSAQGRSAAVVSASPSAGSGTAAADLRESSQVGPDTRPRGVYAIGVRPADPAAALAAQQVPQEQVRKQIIEGIAVGPKQGRSFYFTRGVYSGYRGRRGWGGSWAVDYPKSDRQFLIVLQHLINIDAYEMENPVQLDDPDLRRFPFLYMLEVGGMGMTPAEVKGLREYILAGGFVMIDDFWGTYEWANFEAEIQQVLPEYPIVEIPLDHPIFRVVYKVDEVRQIPSIGNAQWGRTWEGDGRVPHVRGIFDKDGRLLVAINWNTDLGDAWEWAERPEYPIYYSNYALQMGINYVVYAMTH
ncbi:MAG: DUF4159 domain-containing protein [Gemmatimonadetes bacterium]|nr:DUF4159 domain-containing protein [Gemmatimonadota bacterium]